MTSAVLTHGLGDWGTPSLILTLGLNSATAAPVAPIWTLQAQSTDSWATQAESSDIWTTQNTSTDTWTIQ